jgi:hypothetical protein
VTATVAVMGAQEYRRADHVPYIAAAGLGLEACDVRVADVTVTTSGDGRRETTLLLHPSGLPERRPRAGMRTVAGRSLCGASRWPAASTRGLGVVPEDVAAWVVVLLAHPEPTPSREDHPFRDHCVADPDFEALLAAYAPAR